MIISHKYKVIFIHIFKNAGTFITTFLRNLDDQLDTRFIGHITSKKGKYLLEPHIWKSYTKFCVIRNSYDFIVSLYTYTKTEIYHDSHNVVKNMSFKEFVCYNGHEPSQLKQLNFILDDDNKLMVNNIIKFENLKDELINFFQNVVKVDMVCIQNAFPADKLNTSTKEYDHYTGYYDLETIQLVSEIYKIDIDYFKFEFLPTLTASDPEKP